MLISIVTINYNNAEGLKKTIDSVRAQTFSDYEHIIVDGGSTDGSVGAIEAALQDADYAKHVTWWCSEKDGGIYNAMNKGIAHASGDFVFMLNSGDWLCEKSVLAQMAEFLQGNKGCIVFGAVDYYDEKGYLYTYSTSQNDLLKEKNIPHQACFIARNLHQTVGLYDCGYKIFADYDFMIKSFMAGVKFVHAPFVVSNCELVGASSNKELQKKEFSILKKKYYPKENVFAKRSAFFLKLLLPGFAIKLMKLLKKPFSGSTVLQVFA